MPQIIHRERRSHLFLITAAIIVVVLLVVGAIFASVEYKNYLAQQKFKELKATTDALVAGNHLKQAADDWSNYARDASGSEANRAKAWENAGLLYLSTKDYSTALDAFQASVKLTGLTYTKATEVAQAAEVAGNKPVAIQYYKESLNRIPSDMPAVGEQKHWFQSKIDRLEKSQ